MKIIFATQRRAAFALLILAMILLFAGVWRSDLRGSTEPREAGVAAEMLQDGDYLMPRLNGEPFLEKPPLSYWLQSLSIRTFGYNNMAPRLPSICAALVTVMFLFIYITRTWRDTAAGFAAGALLLTMASFWMNARMAGQDALLAFGVTLCLLSFRHTQDAGRSTWTWAGYVVGLSVATLAKGIIGLAIPGTAIFAFLLVDTFWVSRKLELSRWLIPAALAVVAVLPIAVWLYALYQQYGIGAVREVVWVNSVGRFAGEYTRGAHSEPIYYYVKKLPETFQPWMLPFLVAVWQLRGKWRIDRNYLFCLCWLLAPFVMLSFSAGKRPTYLLSLYPAAAILIVIFIQHAMIDGRERLLKLLAVIQAILFTGIAIAIASRLFKIHVPTVAAATTLLMLAALALLWRASLAKQGPLFFAASLLLMSAAYIGYGGFILPHDAVSDSARRMFDQLPRADIEPDSIILLKPSERVSGAARFYARGPVQSVNDYAALMAAWDKNPNALALISAADKADVAQFTIRQKFAYGKEEYWIVAHATPNP